MKPNNALKRDLLFQKKRDDMTKAKNSNIDMITNQNAPKTITDIASDNISNIVKVDDKIPDQSYSNYYENEFKKGLNKLMDGDNDALIQKLSRMIDRGLAVLIVEKLGNQNPSNNRLLFSYFPEFQTLVSKYKKLTFDEFLALINRFLDSVKGRQR